MQSPETARGAPAIAGNDPCENVHAWRLNKSQDKADPDFVQVGVAADDALRRYLLAALRRLRAQYMLAINDIDAAGIAIRLGLVSPVEAVDTLDGLGLDLGDKPFMGEGFGRDAAEWRAERDKWQPLRRARA